MGAYHWSDDHDAMLKDCLTQGMSYSAAAAAINGKFGTAFSRGAAIGRAERTGLRTLNCHLVVKVRTVPPWEQLGITKWRYTEDRRLARTSGTPPVRAPRARSGPSLQPARDGRPLRCDPVMPLRLSLLELTVESCRWPVGGWPSAEPVTFCGQPKMGDRSYCAGHFVLSIIASRPAPLAALEDAA